MSVTTQEPIIIVGAGWSGLTCALSLARQNQRVIVLEAAPQAGGRARKVCFGEDVLDNGQHLLLGAYHHFLTLLKWLNIKEGSVLKRTPFDLRMINFLTPTKVHRIYLPPLPTPLQRLVCLLKIKGFTIKEQIKIGQFFYNHSSNNFQLNRDVSIKELLSSFKQPETLVSKLWSPIAIAALSTPIEEGSAQVFLQILNDAFYKHPSNSDYLFPKTDLSALLPSPIIEYLTQRNNLIFYNQRVQQLCLDHSGQCMGVRTLTQEFKGKVVLATPPHISAQLLSNFKVDSNCNALVKALSKFQYQPITTLYLRYPIPIHLPTPMMGLINCTGHWVFERRMTGHPNILSVVMTCLRTHTELSHAKLAEIVAKELAVLFPSLRSYSPEYRVICEKRAAFSCEVGIANHRPSNLTPISNLWLAGDYTQTPYPATLEGAIQSGIKAAQLILSNHAEAH